jgi:hypothetical protein
VALLLTILKICEAKVEGVRSILVLILIARKLTFSQSSPLYLEILFLNLFEAAQIFSAFVAKLGLSYRGHLA